MAHQDARLARIGPETLGRDTGSNPVGVTHQRVPTEYTVGHPRQWVAEKRQNKKIVKRGK
jgi:hypothetical protein